MKTILRNAYRLFLGYMVLAAGAIVVVFVWTLCMALIELLAYWTLSPLWVWLGFMGTLIAALIGSSMTENDK